MAQLFDEIVAGYFQPFSTLSPMQENCKQFTHRNLKELLAMRQRDKYIKEVKVCVAGLGKADEEEPLEEECFSQFQFYSAYTETLVYYEEKFDFLVKCVASGAARVQPGFEERYKHALLTVLTFRELQPPKAPDQVLDLRQLSTPRTIGENPGSPEKQEEQFETYRKLEHPFGDDLRSQLAQLEAEQKEAEEAAEKAKLAAEAEPDWGEKAAAANEQPQRPADEETESAPVITKTPPPEKHQGDSPNTNGSAINRRHSHRGANSHVGFSESAAAASSHPHHDLPKDAPLGSEEHAEAEELKQRVKELEAKLKEAEEENQKLRAATPKKDVTEDEGQSTPAERLTPPPQQRRRGSSMRRAGVPRREDAPTQVKFEDGGSTTTEDTASKNNSPHKELPKDAPVLIRNTTSDMLSPTTETTEDGNEKDQTTALEAEEQEQDPAAKSLTEQLRAAEEHPAPSALNTQHEHAHDHAHVGFKNADSEGGEDGPDNHPHKELPKDAPLHNVVAEESASSPTNDNDNEGEGPATISAAMEE